MRGFAIFDMDGTIIDSMPAWKSMWFEYLASQGVVPPEDITEHIINKTLGESSQYFIDRYGFSKSREKIISEFHDIMAEKYYQGFPPKKGAVEYLNFLRSCGVRTCVVTATAEKLALSCLQKNGLRDLFDFVISCEKVGKSKAHPDAYHEACRCFRSLPRDTVVFEDAPYAARTAAAAGYYTVGIFDEYYASQTEEMMRICDDYITGFEIAAGKFW